MHGGKNDIPVAFDQMGVLCHEVEWGDLNVGIERFPAGLDTAPIFAGLPENRCQCPHWGYVLRGRFRAVYADREEAVSQGEVYHLPPGHTVVFEEPTEVVEFSPRGEYQKTMEVAERNITAMLDAAVKV